MKNLIILLSLMSCGLFAQTAGQSVINKKNVGSGYTLEAVTLSNDSLLGRNSSGSLASFPISDYMLKATYDPQNVGYISGASGLGLGGSLRLQGAAGGGGGSIYTYAGTGSGGGSIYTYGGSATVTTGGFIYTYGGTTAFASGGSINTRGLTLPGGSIDTSNGGGNINTTAGGDLTMGAGNLTGTAATGNIVSTGDTGTVTNAMLAGSIDLANKVTGTLPVANGGTGITSLGTGVATALGNTVDGANGFLTYSLIGTSGTKLPLLNTANTWGGAQTINVASDAKQLLVKGHSTQTNPLQEWQNSAGTAVAKMSNAGTLFAIPSGAGYLIKRNDGSDPNTGLYSTSTTHLGLVANSTALLYCYGAGTMDGIQTQVYASGTAYLALSTSPHVSDSGDVRFVRDAANVLQMGSDSNTTLNQKIKAHDASSGNNNGASMTIGGGDKAGTGTDGSVILATGTTTRLTASTSGVAIGDGGAAISKVLTNTATLDYDLTASTVEDKTITVTGAADGDLVLVGVPNGSVTTSAQFTGWVSAADTVTIRCRTTAVGENPASGTFRATVIKH